MQYGFVDITIKQITKLFKTNVPFIMYAETHSLEGIIQPKVLSLFIHPHVIPSIYEFISSVK